jgi:uncharacterized protein (DUF58 family)
MRTGIIPTALPLRLVLGLAALAVAALVLGVTAQRLAPVAGIALAALLAALLLDWRLSAAAWAGATPRLHRLLPEALAIGVRSRVRLTLANDGVRRWRLQLFDQALDGLSSDGLPLALALEPRSLLECEYAVTPRQRGTVRFEPAQLRVRGLLGLVWLACRLGSSEQRRVYPDFAQISRYAWLAGDRRLAELGIKTWQRRGEGTDFRQLAEYQPGDAARNIDWKATLRSGRPIVRQYQDERDQNVLLMIDCGRRMRADEQAGKGGHFDQVLNAATLLAYVALRQGDAVGAMTFGVPAGQERLLAPVKGQRALGGLMSALHDLEPTLTHPDYLAAATSLMQRLQRRSLVVLLTNFRDEDSGELDQALRMLRTRHLVMVASLREQVLEDIAAQPLADDQAALEVATARLLAERRAAAFRRLPAAHGLVVDAVPGQLGVELVNRYRTAKASGAF